MRKLVLLGAATIALSSVFGFGISRRGVVEGFYGRPWGTDGRMSMLQFMQEHELNVYVYGPKDDPYHHVKWREPYPETAVADFKRLLAKARESGIDLYWAIHLGDFKGEYRPLFQKLDAMHAIGFRAFALFFDDFGDADAALHAEISNRVQEEFVDRKGDCAPLMICPNIYWGSGHPYQQALGKDLNGRILVMWTGDKVCCDIRAADVAAITKDLRRAPFVWWNWPVNDYCRERLVLGPATGLEVAPVAGMVLNPMENCEADKPGIATFADWCRNPSEYDAEKSYARSLAESYPADVAEAMAVFARHNCDPGPFPDWDFHRPESAGVTDWSAELNRIEAAVRVLKARLPTVSPKLSWEISGWLDVQEKQVEIARLAFAFEKESDPVRRRTIHAAAIAHMSRRVELGERARQRFAAATFENDRPRCRRPVSSARVLEPRIREVLGVVSEDESAACTNGLETAWWQAEINRVARSGGGRVSVSPGVHPVGQLELRSNVELHLERGSVLEGAAGMQNYRPVSLPYSEGTWSAVVAGFGVTNVALTGEGEINGRGERFSMDFRRIPKRVCPEGTRPRGVVFADSANIRLEDFTLRDAACWGVVFKCCDGVVARRVKVDSHAHHNNDGFDIEAKNVLIEDCDVDSGDDGICIKSNTPDYVVENVVVRRCVSRSHCNGLKLGTASHGTMRHVRFENCRTDFPRRDFADRTPGHEGRPTFERKGFEKYPAGVGISAVCVECVDGGTVEDIVYDGISTDGFMVPIFIRGGSRMSRRCGIPPNDRYVLRNIVIRNVRGRSLGSVPSSVTGVSRCRPSGVVLENVSVSCCGEGEDSRPVSEPGPEFDGAYPEATMFESIRLPAYGLYVGRGADVKCNDVRFVLAPGEIDQRESCFVSTAALK